MESTTIEEWAQAFILSTRLSDKLEPSAPPKRFAADGFAGVDLRPGRPEELVVTKKARGFRGAHRSVLARARAAHTFLHHELQAAELMCWCLLRFPDAPKSFRRGLVKIATDELRHMAMYREYIESLGYAVGAFEVRDWFWNRVPQCQSPTEYVATMGMGFEAANLDHSERFASIFEAAGDHSGAALQRHVGQEEIGHVRFAVHWFCAFGAELNFKEWSKHLPAPLSPMVMKGRPLNRAARAKASLGQDFCDELEQWEAIGL
ncbi:MAG: DUF455 family protein [Myxococcales bacterium]|nr:MAG: DUF455 family protein [Myxococcales bacterium]